MVLPLGGRGPGHRGTAYPGFRGRSSELAVGGRLGSASGDGQRRVRCRRFSSGNPLGGDHRAPQGAGSVCPLSQEVPSVAGVGDALPVDVDAVSPPGAGALPIEVKAQEPAGVGDVPRESGEDAIPQQVVGHMPVAKRSTGACAHPRTTRARRAPGVPHGRPLCVSPAGAASPSAAQRRRRR